MKSTTSTTAERVHDAALSLLTETGILLDDAAMRDSLRARGCRVEGRRVRIPDRLVACALAQAPGSFTLFSRDGTRSVVLGEGATRVANSGVAPNIRDLITGERRPSVCQDVADTTRLLDALPGIDLVVATLVEPGDSLPPMSILRGFEATFRNTSKPIIGPGLTNAREAQWAITVGAALRNGLEDLRGRPFFAPWLCPVSPLTFPADLVGTLRTVAEFGLPIGVVTNPVLGVSGPLSIAGSIAQMHAELLATLTIAQVIHPGLPFLYQGCLSVANMRTMVANNGGPDIGRMRAMGVHLGQLCGLPTTGPALITAAKEVDSEFGSEVTTNGILAAQAQPAVLSGVGLINSGLDTSYEAIVAGHEIAGRVLHALNDIVVDDTTLALDVISKVVEGDSFLTQPHTVARLRSGELWTSAVEPRRGFVPAAVDGQSVADRAREIARGMLANHRPIPLRPAEETRVRQVMAEAEADILDH